MTVTEPLDAIAVVKELTGKDVAAAEGFVEFMDDGDETIIEVTVFYRETQDDDKRRLDIVYRLSRFNDVANMEPVDISIYAKA